MENGGCIKVTEVSAGSEAEKAGILKGDRIESYDNLLIGSDVELFLKMTSSTGGREKIPIKISRFGLELPMHVKGGKLGIKVTAGGSSSRATMGSVARADDNEFMTLSGYGKFISGFGWLVVVLGAFAVVLGLGTRNFGIVGIVSGALAIIMGIGLVANGQLISCFVSIERNTKAAAALLESINKHST